MKPVISHKFRISLLLYALALALRTAGICAPAPQPDEINWQRRSFRAVQALHHGRFSTATSHLAHPGVPPALIMGTGQALKKIYSRAFGLAPGDRWFVDYLGAARLANAAFSSLIAPVFFLGVMPVLGAASALTGALLIATDIAHIGNSRLAHLDAALAVLTGVCMFLYFQAALQKSLRLKLAAGVFWGLSIATKPTAAALIPAFLLWKLGKLIWLRREQDEFERGLVTWGDIWAVVAGHAVWAAIHTRLWPHVSAYVMEYKVDSRPADLLYHAGRAMQHHVIMTLAGLALLASLLMVLRRPHGKALSRTGGLHDHAAMALSLLFVLWLTLFIFPSLIENLVRAWTRVTQLPSVGHKSFGRGWTPPPYGYLGMLLSKLPDLTLFGFLLGTVGIAAGFRTLSRTGEGKREIAFLGLMLSVLVVWPLLLSASSKQAFRYILPVIAPVYVIASFGLVKAWEAMLGLAAKTGWSQKTAVPHLTGAGLALAALVLWRGAGVYRLHPDYAFYSNLLGRGFSGAGAFEASTPAAGINEAVRFLQDRAVTQGAPLYVALMTDMTSVEVVYRRLYPRGPALLRFSIMPDLISADYVLAAEALTATFCRQYGVSLDEGFEKVFTYAVQGAPATSIYKALPPTFERPFHHSLAKAFRQAGRTAPARDLLETGEGAVLAADPSEKRHGDYLYFGQWIYFAPGAYRLAYFAALPKGTDASALAAQPVITLEAGPECLRAVMPAELSAGLITRLEAECSFTQAGRRELRGRWYGTAPLVIEGIEIVRLPRP